MNWILALIELDICLFKLLRKFNLLNKKFKLCGRLTPTAPTKKKKKNPNLPTYYLQTQQKKGPNFLKICSSHFSLLLDVIHIQQKKFYV